MKEIDQNSLKDDDNSMKEIEGNSMKEIDQNSQKDDDNSMKEIEGNSMKEIQQNNLSCIKFTNFNS